MASGSIPRPISYALSIVIVLLGLAISYQVYMGSSFSYESKLGSIQLGKGEDATTLAEFVDQSQEALAAAKESISTLESENEKLRDQILKYEQTMREIQATASSGKSGNSQNKVANLSSIVAANEKLSSRSESDSDSMKRQRYLLDKQLTFTKGLRQQLLNTQEQQK